MSPAKLADTPANAGLERPQPRPAPESSLRVGPLAAHMSLALSRMARTFVPPAGEMVTGVIGAIMRGRRDDNNEEFRATIKRAEFEVVLPEFVFGAG